MIIVDLKLPFADVKKTIDASRHLDPELYLLEFDVYRWNWLPLRNEVEWRCCLQSQKGKEFVELRCRMLEKGNNTTLK